LFSHGQKQPELRTYTDGDGVDKGEKEPRPVQLLRVSSQHGNNYKTTKYTKSEGRILKYSSRLF
jgi:hypothetical protein